MTPTELLHSWRKAGNREAFDGLVSLLYQELDTTLFRSHTLQTQALLHEAYMRLIDASVDWHDRAHFLAIAARTMRRVLVDHAKARRRIKRDAGLRVDINDAMLVSGTPPPVDVIVLSDAMDRLAAQDARQARIVELHFFGGLTCDETAEALSVSTTTVERDLRVARAWLRRDLSGGAA